MTDTNFSRRLRRIMIGSALAVALVAGAPALAGTAVAAPAAGPAPAAVAPPDAPQNLTLAYRNGSGARGIAFTASWTQPDLHGGTSPRRKGLNSSIIGLIWMIAFL